MNNNNTQPIQVISMGYPSQFAGTPEFVAWQNSEKEWFECKARTDALYEKKEQAMHAQMRAADLANRKMKVETSAINITDLKRKLEDDEKEGKPVQWLKGSILMAEQNHEGLLRNLADFDNMPNYPILPQTMPRFSVEDFMKTQEEENRKLDGVPLTMEDATESSIMEQYRFGGFTEAMYNRKKNPTLRQTRLGVTTKLSVISEKHKQIECLESVKRNLLSSIVKDSMDIMKNYEMVTIIYPPPNTDTFVRFYALKGDPFVADNEREFCRQTEAEVMHEPISVQAQERLMNFNERLVSAEPIDMASFVTKLDEGRWFYTNFSDGNGNWKLK